MHSIIYGHCMKQLSFFILIVIGLAKGCVIIMIKCVVEMKGTKNNSV